MKKDKSQLVKMSELVRLSGTPAPTIKHYIREGLLPEPSLRTSPNMAYYDPSMVSLIKTIKTLQKTKFLPLKVIKELLDGAEQVTDEQRALNAIAQVLKEDAQQQKVTRIQLLEAGHPEEELRWLVEQSFITPTREGEDVVFSGEDVSLLQTLREARVSGLSESMLPTTILGPYREAVQQLVLSELALFRQDVMPQAGDKLPELTAAATRLSEKLVIHLRRKALIPLLTTLSQERQADADQDQAG